MAHLMRAGALQSAVAAAPRQWGDNVTTKSGFRCKNLFDHLKPGEKHPSHRARGTGGSAGVTFTVPPQNGRVNVPTGREREGVELSPRREFGVLLARLSWAPRHGSAKPWAGLPHAAAPPGSGCRVHPAKPAAARGACAGACTGSAHRAAPGGRQVGDGSEGPVPAGPLTLTLTLTLILSPARTPTLTLTRFLLDLPEGFVQTKRTAVTGTLFVAGDFPRFAVVSVTAWRVNELLAAEQVA
eukprot:scaffold2766_cov42-Phaeocystis_antarctica.AAC.1